jgi:hypothetical protein
VQVEYVSPLNVRNHIVVWDKLLTDKAMTKGRLTDVNPEYDFIDQGYHLRGANVTLVAYYDIMPHAGMMKTVKLASSKTFTLPAQYKD